MGSSDPPHGIHWHSQRFQDVAISLNPWKASLLKNTKWRIFWVLKLKDPSKFQFKIPLKTHVSQIFRPILGLFFTVGVAPHMYPMTVSPATSWQVAKLIRQLSHAVRHSKWKGSELPNAKGILIINIHWLSEYHEPMVVKMCVFHCFSCFSYRDWKITGTATTVVSSTGTSNPRTFSSCQAILTHQRSWLTSVPCCNGSLRPWGPWGPYGCSWGY